jgi:hypothetical protein
LPLTILARSHCHDLILQMTPVETSQFFRAGILTFTTGC